MYLRQAAVLGDHRGDAVATEMADHRPGRETARTARQLRHIVRGIAITLGDRRQIARGDGHRAAMRLGISHDGVATIVWRL